MLAVEVEFLTGRYVATAYNDRDAPEWPPHPARLFSALVATWADAPDEQTKEAERSALEWLERAGAPDICAGGCAVRTVMTHYVPVNDVTVISDIQKYRDQLATAVEEVDARRTALEDAKNGGSAKGIRAAEKALAKAEKMADKATAKLKSFQQQAIEADGKVTKQGLKNARAVLPAHRIRQARTFPSVTLHDPSVVLRWPVQPDGTQRTALDGLLRRVIRLGHSSSFVRCALTDQIVEPDFVPDDEGDLILRVPLPGQVDRLEQEYQLHQEVEPRILPCRFQRYRRAGAGARTDPPVSVFSDRWIVWRRVGGPRYNLTRTVEIAQAIRGALMQSAEDPPPPMISGHDEDGSPSNSPHAAVVPLPFVGHRHADGSVLGVALVLPRNLPDDVQRTVLRAVGRWEEKFRFEDEEVPVVPALLGRVGKMELERIAWGRAPLSALRSSTWCRPARTWISATPVALDRNPGHLYSRDHATSEAAYQAAEESIAQACVNIGLPEPTRVVVLPSVSMPGTEKARRFPGYPPDPKRIQRVKVHARIEFAEAVRGPVLIGAGRYYGLGLFRPFDDEDGDDARVDA